MAIVVYLLLADELGERKVNPILLATILSWMYFVRPTYAVMIVAITVYILWARRDLFLRYAITGCIWLLGFVLYSWSHYHALLPTYFRVNRRAGFAYFWAALAGNLISPSRGLLVYVPVLIFVSYLAVRYRKTIAPRRLMLLASGVIVTFLVVISGFDPWWAGASYGPRYTAPLIPWFVLLAVLGIRAMVMANDNGLSKRLALSLGGLLLVLSVSINAIGAVSKDAWITWNAYGDIDHDPWKVWDLRYPQLLAPFIRPPLPNQFPVASQRIDLASAESQHFLPYGWSGPETSFRWTDGKEAAVIFALNEVAEGLVRIRLSPFLVKGKHDLQRVEIRLNDKTLKSLELREDAAAIYEVPLPKEVLSRKNVLIFRLPDAAPPSDFNLNSDERRLGIAVSWVEFSFGEGKLGAD